MSTQGRAPQQEPESWYAANTGNDSQGLIVDEKTGANIAVAYDRKHAPLLAAAPAMYAELGKCVSLIQALQARLNAHGEMCNFDDEEIASAKAALAQAEGRQA